MSEQSTKENFQVGDHVKFDVVGTDLRGTGIVMGKASHGIKPAANFWIVQIQNRDTNYMKTLKNTAMTIQECAMQKKETRMP